MTILDVVKQAATQLGLEIPSVVFTNTTRTWIDVQNTINRCAYQILDEYDWERLKQIHVLNGDGAQEDFDFPDDFYRMTRDARLWDSASPAWNVGQVQSEAWLALDQNKNVSWRSLWTIFGGQMHFRPALYSEQTVRFFYISKNIVSGDKTEFTADTDAFVLDEKLLRKCLVYNWKKDKGMDYAADLQEYQEALSYAIGSDKGPRRIYEGTHNGYVPDIFAAIWGR